MYSGMFYAFSSMMQPQNLLVDQQHYLPGKRVVRTAVRVPEWTNRRWNPAS